MASALAVLLLAACTTHGRSSAEPDRLPTAGPASSAGTIAPSSEPMVSSVAPSSACGTAALPADSPNFCVAPPGYAGPLTCIATMLRAHPTVVEPAVIEITTLMWASLRVVATGATFSAAQDVQADAQARASVSLDISRATTGSPVNVAVKAYLQDATAADCTTTFTPVAATPPDPSP